MIQGNDRCAPEFEMDGIHRFEAARNWESDRPEMEDVPAYFKRRSAGVWTCLATLAVALAVVVAYGYSVLRQEGIQSEQVPGIAKSLPAIAQHVSNLERRLADSRAYQQNLASEMQKIDAKSMAALDQTRQQTGKQITSVKDALLKGLNQQTLAFQAQLAELMSERNANRLQLAQVEEQLSKARDELETARKDYESQVAALREQQGIEDRELASISSSLPTRQVAFEAQKNQAAEVIPGVTFHLTKTDVRHQRFDGTIVPTPGKQRISVQSQSVQSPVTFFPSEEVKPYVMVVTSIDQKGVTGYLLIPAKSGTMESTDFISAADNPLSPASIGLENNGAKP
ncbi:MAG TPA: hypothetical protein VEN79_13185 [Terriglobia bacterium]|nr:hypothetical protein [Terriglobia bacterium]